MKEYNQVRTRFTNLKPLPCDQYSTLRSIHVPGSGNNNRGVEWFGKYIFQCFFLIIWHYILSIYLIDLVLISAKEAVDKVNWSKALTNQEWTKCLLRCSKNTFFAADSNSAEKDRYYWSIPTKVWPLIFCQGFRKGETFLTKAY